MIKCKCYEEHEANVFNPVLNNYTTTTVGICNGTKERERCCCGGKESKCDFYDYIRKRASLEQAEMFKSSALYVFEDDSFPKVEVVDLSVNALIKALFERSDKEKQPFPWWIIEEIYEWKDKKYKGE